MAIPGPSIPSAPWVKYTFPKIVRKVQTTALSTTPYVPAPVGKLGKLDPRKVVVTELKKTPFKAGKVGKRVPLSKRKLATIALVTTVGLAIIPILRALFPPRKVVTKDLKPSDIGILKPGKGATGGSVGRREHDPYGDFNFRIQIEGIEAGAFQKVDGLEASIDMIEYKDSMDPYPRKRPGMPHYGNIKLTKGVIKNTALWDWCTKIMAGEMERKNGTIHILDDAGQDMKAHGSYDFFQAFPIKWSGLRVDGKGGATLVEELELAIDHFVRTK